MAKYQGHISFSTIFGVLYAFVGYYFLAVFPHQAILAAVLFVIAGVLPNLDSRDEVTSRELTSLIAAIMPVVFLQLYPQYKDVSSSQLAIIILGTYLSTRVVLLRGLRRFTVHRGIVHSIPAAILVSQLSFLLFRDQFWVERLYLTLAVSLGYLSHLIIDAWANIDLVGSAVGKEKKSGGSALKFIGPHLGSTIFVYLCIAILSYYIAREFYPNLDVKTSVEVSY